MIDSTRGAARELIGLEEYSKQLAKGTLVTDDRRRRPLWFDGRFLDAAALNSEQNYILGRQADIARVAGVGIPRSTAWALRGKVRLHPQKSPFHCHELRRGDHTLLVERLRSQARQSPWPAHATMTGSRHAPRLHATVRISHTRRPSHLRQRV